MEEPGTFKLESVSIIHFDQSPVSSGHSLHIDENSVTYCDNPASIDTIDKTAGDFTHLSDHVEPIDSFFSNPESQNSKQKNQDEWQQHQYTYESDQDSAPPLPDLSYRDGYPEFT